MKVVRWIVLFTGATLLLSTLGIGGMLLYNDFMYPGAVEHPAMPRAHAAAPVESTPMPAFEPYVPGPPPSTELPMLHRHRPSDPAQTLVQEQPSFYSECFGETTWACRRRFNRTISETALMRRFREGHPDLPAITKLVLGRIILSEVNWLHDERRDRYFPDQNHAERDAPAIYQVFRHTRRTGETLLGAMRRHSPHISEVRAITGHLTDRRMVWIARLQLDCNRPTGFPATDRAGNPIDWDDDGYRERCENLFIYAQRLLDGDSEVVAWTDAPLVTWGGRCETPEGACDDDNGWARGLVPFETGDTANRFWCRPGVEGCPVPAEVAAATPTAAEEPAPTEEATTTTEVQEEVPVASEEVPAVPTAT